MEKLLNAQILRYLENHSLLYQHQSGFLPGHSTVTQLCFLVHQWQMAADRGDHVQATFLDLSKAYDRVSIPGLLFKLSCLGFSYSALQWLSTFLTKRLQSVKVNGCQSKWQTPKSGIPQGTVLGPVLFLVFINDLPLSLQNGCSIFADDTTAYTIGDTVTSTCSALSLDLAAASSWAKTWGMLYNAEKSEHLPINTNGRGNVDMDGTIIPQVTAHRHLGVMLNQKLTWNNHIDNLYTSCARRVGILRRLRNKLQSQVFKKNFHWFHSPEAGVRMCCVEWRTHHQAHQTSRSLLSPAQGTPSTFAEEVPNSLACLAVQDASEAFTEVLVIPLAGDNVYNQYVQLKKVIIPCPCCQQKIYAEKFSPTCHNPMERPTKRHPQNNILRKV